MGRPLDDNKLMGEKTNSKRKNNSTNFERERRKKVTNNSPQNVKFYSFYFAHLTV